MKIVKPKKVHVFHEGDKVIYENPKYPKYTLEGIVTGTYHGDRHLVKTDGGHEWALFTHYLTYAKSESPNESR